MADTDLVTEGQFRAFVEDMADVIPGGDAATLASAAADATTKAANALAAANSYTNAAIAEIPQHGGGGTPEEASSVSVSVAPPAPPPNNGLDHVWHALGSATHPRGWYSYSFDEGDWLPTDVGPYPIIDLAAAPGADLGSVELSWTQPGNGGSAITSLAVEQRDGIGTAPAYFVSDGRIYDPSGKYFYPVGANNPIKITPYPYVWEHPSNYGTIASYEGDPVTFPSHVDAAQAWGWNMIRVNCLIVNNDPEGPNPGDPAGFADLIAHGVNELIAAGFVVMLEVHDGMDQSPMPDDAVDVAAKLFWARCIELWGSEPRLWLNPWNEPYGDSSPASVANWITLHTDTINFLRTEGYAGPIICDLPNWAQGIDVLARGDLDSFATIDPGIVFGWHAYGNVSTTGSQNTFETHERLATEARARGHCVLIGEFGQRTPPGVGIEQWLGVAVDWVTTRARAHQMGAIWWSAGHDNFRLMQEDAIPFWTSVESGVVDITGLSVSGLKHYRLGAEVGAPAAPQTSSWPGPWVSVTVEGTTSPVVIESLDEGSLYDYRVAAVNADGQARWSNVASASATEPSKYVASSSAFVGGVSGAVNAPVGTLVTDTVIAFVKVEGELTMPVGFTQIPGEATEQASTVTAWRATGLVGGDPVQVSSDVYVSGVTLVTLRDVGELTTSSDEIGWTASTSLSWGGVEVDAATKLLLVAPFAQYRTVTSASAMTATNYNATGLAVFYEDFPTPGPFGPVDFAFTPGGSGLDVLTVQVS